MTSADPHAHLKAELKALPKAELKRFWADLGYILLPAAPEWHDRPTTDVQRSRLLTDITAALGEDLRAIPELGGAGQGGEVIRQIVEDFYDLIPRSPVPAKKGGNGFNGCLQIYAVARLLRPKVIIESGVFRGQTTWIFRQACPDATIFCFDVDFTNLRYKDRDAIYTEADWASVDLSGLPARQTLCFFDDHIDQGLRVRQAHALGFKHILFDDNAAAARIHTVGGPPIPSLDMLMDSTLDGETLGWTYRGRNYGCTIDTDEANAVRKIVATLRNFADMHRVTGYTPARITYVSLR